MVLKAVLKDQRDIHTDSTGRHVAPPDTLFWFRANQSLVFLLNKACRPPTYFDYFECGA
jgi:hypothetical protein